MYSKAFSGWLSRDRGAGSIYQHKRSLIFIVFRGVHALILTAILTAWVAVSLAQARQ